jgi:hypothetical protein
MFLLFGSSGAGKTVAIDALRARAPSRLAIHDFDEVGVPPDADTEWRQRMDEVWVRRALEYEAGGIDLLLAGQTPIGELLATPSAPSLEAVSACLLDCDDETRLARLRLRPVERRTGSPDEWPDLLDWAAWMREHARNPRWMQHVIAGEGPLPEMCWERRGDWRAGDPQWRVHVIDTSKLSVEEVADELAEWIGNERAGVHS